MAFPVIETPQEVLTETVNAGTIRSDFEAGYTQTRAKFTRMRQTFELKWKYLPSTDYAVLKTYFESTAIGGAQSFTWAHGTTDYVCRFAEDRLTFDYIPPDYYQGGITLMEV